MNNTQRILYLAERGLLTGEVDRKLGILIADIAARWDTIDPKMQTRYRRILNKAYG